jgi:acetyltransferase
MGGTRAERGRKILSRAGIPTYDTPERAAATLASLTAYVRNIEMSQEIPPKVPHPLTFERNEADGILREALRQDERTLAGPLFKALLKAYGIPVEGRRTSSTSRGAGFELRLGVQRYAEVGPVLLFGPGDPWSKVLRDQAVGLPPLNRLLARRLMEKTRAYRLLETLAGTTSRVFPLLEEVLIRLSQLTTDFPAVEAIEVDALVAERGEVVAVDGTARIHRVDLPSPLHLAISPYPNQYEWTTRTKGGIEVFIRPIRPEDAPLLLELFASMSRQSIWFRFLGPVTNLSPEMLHQMTQIDYDRDMALVALGKSEAPGKMLGCCHLIKHPRYGWAEIAPMVGNAWQGRGIGAKLLEYCLAVAGERGIESVRGMVSLQNRHMLSLASRFSMTRTPVPGSNEVELQIDLTSRALPSVKT